MKKTILAIVASTVFISGAAMASVNPNDVSANLTVTGTVTASATACAIQLDQATMTFNVDTADMPREGGDSLDNPEFHVNITGEGCADLASKGLIAYKMKGVTDEADGLVLANNGTAEGVGVGIYNTVGVPQLINNSISEATGASTTFGINVVKLTGRQAKPGTVDAALTIEIERL